MIVLLMALAATGAADDCGARSNQTAMTLCQAEASDRADAEMNGVWKRLYPAMQAADRERGSGRQQPKPGYAAAALASQRAWLAFRDAECRIQSYEWDGGSMQPFTHNQCTTELTRARTGQLRGMLDWLTR